MDCIVIETTFIEGSELAVTLADLLREEGWRQGIEKGSTDALPETALQMLIERFGKVPLDIKEGIGKTDSAAWKPFVEPPVEKVGLPRHFVCQSGFLVLHAVYQTNFNT